MNRYFALFFIIVGFSVRFSYAQTNYKNAIIVNLKGDSIKGYIDYKNWEINPLHIKFKKDLSTLNEVFTPKDILAFEVEKEKYISATLEVSYSSSDINRITDSSPKPETAIKTVFLKSVIEGDKSLYSYKSISSESNFYIKNNGKFELLIYKKYLDTASYKILENLNYRNQLYTYLEYPLSLQTAIEKTQYSQNSLQHIFELYYNKYEQKNVSYSSTKDSVKLALGATIGGMHRSFNIKDISYFAPKTTPALGIFFNVAMPRNFQKLNFHSDLLFVYSTYKDKKDIYETGFSTATIVDAYNLNVSSLKLSNSLRYVFYQQGDFGVFLQAGITNSFIVFVNNEKTRYTTRYGNTTEDKLTAVSNLRKYEQGYLFGIGAKKNRYDLDFRFEKTNGISSSRKTNFKAFYILASYAF